ncbi:MAG: hypothetical protein WBB67_11430 [bacterium]
MSRYVILLIIVFVNLVLHLLHYNTFGKSKEFRKAWAAATIGWGFGLIFYHLPELVYGFPVDISVLWTAILFCVTGIGMYFLNRYGKRSETSN